jgi:ornithine carbamoyltransferase
MSRRPHRSSSRAGLGKDFLELLSIPVEELTGLLRLAAQLKVKQRRGVSHPLLQGRMLGLLFQKPSTRTRVSFEAGMNQLGGQAMVLPMGDIQLSRGESVADTAHVLSRYLDAIVLRTFDHAIAEEWAREASIPVINGLTDLNHPCQALSDLLTIQEKKRRLKGIKIAYVGDGNNVTNSLIEAAAKMGMTIAVGCPPGYQPDRGIVDRAREEARQTGAVIEIGADPFVAGERCGCGVYRCLDQHGTGAGASKRLKILAPYQLNARLLKCAKPDALVMHCLPAHRGEEISAEVLDGPQSVVFDQAENRLHMQKAILVRLLGKKPARST